MRQQSRLPLGEERANILLLACCYQEGSNPGGGACRRRRPTQVRSRGDLSRFLTYDIDLATKSRDIIGAQDFLQNAECDGAHS